MIQLRYFTMLASLLVGVGFGQVPANAQYPARVQGQTWFMDTVQQGLAWQKSQAALTRLSEKPDAIGLQSVLQTWVREFPNRVQLESYGHSRAGRNLPLLRLVPKDPGTKEWQATGLSAWVIPPLGPNHDPGRLLKQIQACLQDPSFSVPFEVLIPVVPDPDGWIDGEASVCLERNFPSGWSPWCGDQQNPGAAPLSEPESQQLVRLRLEYPGSIGLVRWSPEGAGSPYQGPGSLVRYAGEVWQMPTVNGTGEAQDLKRMLKQLEVQRDRLEVEILEIERLSTSLWAIDLSVSNRGSSVVFGLQSGLNARWSGAQQRAVAFAPQGTLHYEVLESDRPIPAPRAGETLRHRWIVECSPDAVLEIVYGHARLGSLATSISLPKDHPTPR